MEARRILRLPLVAIYATQRMLVPQAGLVVLPPCQAGTPPRRDGAEMAESAKGKRKVATVMREFARGALRSGSKRGPKVEKPAQAKAIAMSEGRRVAREKSAR